MGNFTKLELIDALANRTGLTHAQVTIFLQETLDVVTEQLTKGKSVTVRRFGVFDVRVSKAKLGRKPGVPGSEMVIPARSVVRFRPSTELKAAVAKTIPEKQRRSVT